MNNRPNTIFGAKYGENVDPSRWVVIYPPYIDKTKTEKEGRKIAKEKCVEKPNGMEIFDCAQLLGLQTALEVDKAYCRDYWQRGRIRVRLFDSDKKAVREDIPSRRVLYAKIAELVPKHREQVKAAEAKKSGNTKAGGTKSGSGKGAPAPVKKKKKGKR